MPEEHVRVVHFAAVVQQRAAVLPAVLYLPVSLNLPTGQVTTFPPHLLASFTQQMLVFSEVVQVDPAQYVVRALVICFLPAAHVTDEHFALFEQHRASLLPMTPYFVGSLNLLAPQATDCA
jgi:hypothetical protein